MLMRFAPTPTAEKLHAQLLRLRRNSVSLELPQVVEDGEELDALDFDAVAFTEAACRLRRFSVDKSGKVLTAAVRLGFEKDRAAVFVSPNYELVELLGYMPAYQPLITASSWDGPRPVQFVLSSKLSEAQAKAVGELDYLCDLHIVPVG